MPEDAQSAQANQDVGVWSTESFIAGLCKEVSGPPIALNSLKGFSKTFFFYWLFRAAPEVYGSSQARDGMGAAVANLHHSTRHCWVLNPLREARDRTPASSWILIGFVHR